MSLAASTSSAAAPTRKHDPLLQPLTIKHVTLRNRIMSTSHEPAYSEDGLPKERYRLYRDERVAFSTPRFAWIDTLFALPEAALFAQAASELGQRMVAVGNWSRLQLSPWLLAEASARSE